MCVFPLLFAFCFLLDPQTSNGVARFFKNPPESQQFGKPRRLQDNLTDSKQEKPPATPGVFPIGQRCGDPKAALLPGCHELQTFRPASQARLDRKPEGMQLAKCSGARLFRVFSTVSGLSLAAIYCFWARHPLLLESLEV